MDSQRVASEIRAVSKIVDSATRQLQAGSEDIVADGIKEAIRALEYKPIEYAFPDPKRGQQAKRRVRAVIDELEALLAELPVPVEYAVYGLRKKIKTDDPQKLIDILKKEGFRHKGFSNRGRGILVGQPEFEGLAGPMYDGPGNVRYETWETYDMLSK